MGVAAAALGHLLVIRQSARRLEHHASADLDGVVSEALVEAAQQRDVDRGADSVVPFAVDQQREQVPVLGVDGIVLTGSGDSSTSCAVLAN